MMTNAQLAAASFDDIVFDGRNKGYGAYQLRGLYQRHVSRALVIATTLFALLVFSPVVANYLSGDEQPPVVAKPPIPVGPIDPPPLDQEKEKVLPPPPPVAPPPPPPVAQIRFTPPVVAKETEATEDVPEAAELEGKKIGTETVDGPDEATVPLVELPPAEVPKELGNAVSDKPYISVEQMPELPGGGGVLAIVAAIQKATKYPSPALRNGVEGRLFASFTVNAQGEVTDVKIVKGLGSGLDEETIRAINTLPRFIPGKQNGQAVSVSYTVPITFKIQ